MVRLLVLIAALWFSPASFANEDTEEVGPSVAAALRGGCPGGVCRPHKRPRPTR